MEFEAFYKQSRHNVIIIKRDNLQVKRYTFHNLIFKSELYVFEILNVIQILLKNVMRILYLYTNKYIYLRLGI